MKNPKKYPVDQSPFYKLSNHEKLAKILGADAKTIQKIVKRGDKNYKIGVTEDGRAIQIPKSQILRIHSRINKLLNRIETPDYLVSGVKGRSHVYNAKIHAGNHAVAKLDIQKYYPSTSKEIIRKGLRKKFKCSNDISNTLSELCTVNGHVPTGSPISQSLSFFVNAPIFDHINIYARSRQLQFSLYVDDLTFSGKEIPKNFLSYVAGFLKEHRGYKTHKFRVYGRDKCKVITGVVVKGEKITLKNCHRKEIGDLYRKLDYFSDPIRKNDERTTKYFQRYIGHLFSAGAISPRYKEFGKDLVKKRKDLGISARN